MSDEVDYGSYSQDTFTAMDNGGAEAAQTRFTDNLLDNRDPCDEDGCRNNELNPGEEPFIQLMSAIPQAGQVNNIKAKPSDMATPADMEVSAIVEMLRGTDGDLYAIGAVKEGWQQFREVFQYLAGDLTSALEALSMEWTGKDFDAFADQVDIVSQNFTDITEKVSGSDGIIPLLDQKQSAIYELQGGDSGEVPYPAPLVWVDGGNWFTRACIHIRPAFWDGNCDKEKDACANESGTRVMEMAGMDPGYQDEVNSFVEDRKNYYHSYYNSEANGYQPGSFSEEEALQMAQTDAENQINQDVGDVDENYQERLNNVNEDIASRRDYADTETSTFTPTNPTVKPTTLGTGETEEKPYTPPTGGGGGGMPSASGGLSDMNPPSMTPSSPTSPSFDPPSPTTPTTPDPGGFDPDGLDDNPWESSTPDPDDISGGLASGGGGLSGGGMPGGGMPGGGPGGGLGGGAGGGMPGGMGAGMGGGMMGGAGGGRGAGAGAGGRGAGKGGGPKGMGGKGMAGGMMGGAGGGRGMGGQGEGDQESGTWLTEDDDVWGIGNEDSDPYA